MNVKRLFILTIILANVLNFKIMAQTKVTVEESILINVSKEQLWEITALNFDKIGDWSAGVKESNGRGTGINGAVCLERVCEPSYKGFKETTERLIDYQPENFEFTYQIVEGLPKMVILATNKWIHQEEGEGTRITMSINMELKGLMGKIMKKPMGKRMSKILKQNLEELKVYAETGELHERKKKIKM